MRAGPTGSPSYGTKAGEPPARITLTGLSPRLWCEALAAAGTGRPLDLSTAWSAKEKVCHEEGPGRAPEHYIGSGVLRMAAALGGPAATRAARLSVDPVTDERGRRRWQCLLELSGGPDRDALLTALTDSDLALGLELWKRACSCGGQDGMGCTMTLTDGCGQIFVAVEHLARRRPESDLHAAMPRAVTAAQ